MNSKVCCFFGHHDASSEIKPLIRQQIVRLITEEQVYSFLVGNQGAFDGMVYAVLKELKGQYHQIFFNVVLAYMPSRKEEYTFIDPMDTLHPEGLESVPKRFAISWRNNWMLKQSQIVICYNRHSMGGSGKFVERAKRQGKEIINIANSGYSI